MAVGRLADSEAAALFTSTVLIEAMQPGESLTFEQLIARSEQIAQQTGRDDLRARIFATRFLADWYRANGMNRGAEEVLTRTIDSLPADSPHLGSALRCARAYTWSQLGRTGQAVASLENEIALNEHDPSVAADCMLQLSRLANLSGDAHTAFDFAQRARARYEEAGVVSIYGRTDVLKALGAAYGLRDEFATAHGKYREALKLFADAGRGRSRPAAHLHDEWSSVWMNAGNPLRALAETDIAWNMTRELSPHAQPTDSRVVRRARILGQLARFAEAETEWARALELSRARGNLVNVAAAHIGQAEIDTLQGRRAEAQLQLQLAEAALRESALPVHHVLNGRYAIANAALLAARGNPQAASAELTRSLEQYRALDCCRAQMALSLAMRSELALGEGRVADAAADARAARDLAPPIGAASFSLFTGNAWLATGLVYERQGRRREARDAFATAAVQFAGAEGDGHPDTLRAREAIQRVS
jgi:tetratricopeptide (TPR) repeat protein